MIIILHMRVHHWHHCHHAGRVNLYLHLDLESINRAHSLGTGVGSSVIEQVIQGPVNHSAGRNLTGSVHGTVSTTVLESWRRAHCWHHGSVLGVTRVPCMEGSWLRGALGLGLSAAMVWAR